MWVKPCPETEQHIPMILNIKPLYFYYCRVYVIQMWTRASLCHFPHVARWYRCSTHLWSTAFSQSEEHKTTGCLHSETWRKIIWCYRSLCVWNLQHAHNLVFCSLWKRKAPGERLKVYNGKIMYVFTAWPWLAKQCKKRTLLMWKFPRCVMTAGAMGCPRWQHGCNLHGGELRCAWCQGSGWEHERRGEACLWLWAWTNKQEMGSVKIRQKHLVVKGWKLDW